MEEKTLNFLFQPHCVHCLVRAGHPLKPSSLCVLWLSVGFFEWWMSTPPVRTPEKLWNLHNQLVLEERAVIFNDCNTYCERSPIYIKLVKEAVLKFMFQLQFE